MNVKYPWHTLKKPGDSFRWTDLADENSLRANACKYGKKHRRQFIVSKEQEPPKYRTVLIVTLYRVDP